MDILNECDLGKNGRVDLEKLKTTLQNECSLKLTAEDLDFFKTKTWLDALITLETSVVSDFPWPLCDDSAKFEQELSTNLVSYCKSLGKTTLETSKFCKTTLETSNVR